MKNTGIPLTVSIRKTTILISTQWVKGKGQSVVTDELTKHPPNGNFANYIPDFTLWWDLARHRILIRVSAF